MIVPVTQILSLVGTVLPSLLRKVTQQFMLSNAFTLSPKTSEASCMTELLFDRLWCMLPNTTVFFATAITGMELTNLTSNASTTVDVFVLSIYSLDLTFYPSRTL